MKKNTSMILISVLAIFALVFCVLFFTTSAKKNSEIATLNATVAELGEKIESLNAEVTDSNNELLERAKTIEDLKAETEEKIESLNAEITDLNNELLERAKTIEDLKADTEEKTANIQLLSETVTDLEGQVAAAGSSIEALSTEVSNLTEELAARESTIKEQTSSIAERDLTIESLNARIEELESTIEELNKKIESLSVQITQYKDLGAMSTDELLEIKAIVTAELISRPENEATVLKTGDYLVGRDIKAGAYYATYGGGTWTSGELIVYSNANKDEKVYKGHISKSISTVIQFTVEDGNLICVEDNDVKINTTGFPEYIIPDGTRIPVGVYQIGVDIPADNYILYYSGEGYASIDIYANKEKYDKDIEQYWASLDAIDNQVVLALEDGNYLSVKNSAIIMKKGNVTFSFD